jgi:hypothetical protein
MKLPGRRHEYEIGPAGFGTHLLKLAGGSPISNFSSRDVTPLPIGSAMIAKDFRRGHMERDFLQPDHGCAARASLATLGQGKKWRDCHGAIPAIASKAAPSAVAGPPS